jgi:UDP-N-acetylglucosamine--N-acetylmuramyl-(pentapeptide) pyrophosphoryl-undecaprenol N-acetylglucosamine transferase
LPRSAIETALIIGEFQPDVVVGIGGYLAGPAMLESALKDIPTLLIEPNAVPGFTNRVLAPVVRMAAVAFKETASFYRAKGRLTGHAVRKGFSFVPAKEHVPPYAVLILGGSQGSAAINDCVVRSLPRLANDAARLTFIHQTGDRDYNAVRQAYQERGLTAEVQAFIENVPEAFARADLIVSRAGATAVAELAAAGKAALLIPFPDATDQHQLENARAMERAGAARVLRQAELTPERLVRELWDLLGDPRRLVEMERAAKRLARPDAAERIADLIQSLAVGRHLQATDY